MKVTREGLAQRNVLDIAGTEKTLQRRKGVFIPQGRSYQQVSLVDIVQHMTYERQEIHIISYHVIKYGKEHHIQFYSRAATQNIKYATSEQFESNDHTLNAAEYWLHATQEWPLLKHYCLVTT